MKTFMFILCSVIASAIFAQTDVTTLDTIQRQITDVQADSLIQANNTNPDFVVMDVRQPGPYAYEHLINAINIDYYLPNFDSLIQVLDHNKSYLIYCQGGSRSYQTWLKMKQWHFREIYNKMGGISSWIAAGYPTTLTSSITELPNDSYALVFQNPVSGSFQITISPPISGTLQIVDMTGKTVFYSESVSSGQPVDLSGEPDGLYFLRFVSGNSIQTAKLLKLE
jgi:phage shock protein E